MRKRTIHTGQRVIAYVLLMSQILTSCGGFNETVFDKKQGPIPQSAHVENLSTEEVATDSLSTYGPYTLKNGDQVQFVKEDGKWMAQVTVFLPLGFKIAPFTLPVYLQRGVGMQDINSRAYIGITLPSKHNKDNGYVVCARQAGLLGGMPPPTKHPQCDYSGDKYTRNSNGDWVCPSGKHTVKGNLPKKATPPKQNPTSGPSNPPRRNNPPKNNTSNNSNPFFTEWERLDREQREREEREKEEKERKEREERECELAEIAEKNAAILEKMIQEGKEFQESCNRFEERFSAQTVKFAKEQAEEALKTEAARQENFNKRLEESKKRKQEELDTCVSQRNKIQQGESKHIRLSDLVVIKNSIGLVNLTKRSINSFRESLTNNGSRGLSDVQKEVLERLLKTIDRRYSNLEKEKSELEYFVAHPDPNFPTYNAENLQILERLLVDLKQQRLDLAQMVSAQGDDISNYTAPPKSEARTENVEDTQANKDLFLAISDPSDSKELVSTLEQQMKRMIAEHAPVPTTTATLKISESIKSQAKELATQAYALQQILTFREYALQDAYFGESMNDYIDRSTEEGVEKIKCIQAAIDQLEAIDGLFKARFHVEGYSPDIVPPPRLTQSYINSLVNALVDQMVPGSELAQGNTTPTTAESWADLALSAGLDALQKTDPNSFKDAAGVKLLITPAGSTRYNLFKRRIVEVYQQRTGATGTKQSSTSASSSQQAGWFSSFFNRFSSSSKAPEKSKEDKPKNEVEQITKKVNEYLENHSKGAASKAEGGDLLTRTEALKKETKASYRRIYSLVDSDEPNAGLFMEQALQKHKDLNQLRDLRKQLKEVCKFSKEELESCKVRLKPKEGDEGFQTDSSCEDGISREDWAFNKGVLKGVGPGIVAALKGSAEGLYHLATSPVATIEGLVEFLENIDEVPGLLAASLEELEGMEPEQQGEAIAKFITEQVFTLYNPVSNTKLLQQVSKTKLGAAAVKVGQQAGNIKFYAAEELARRFGVSKEIFHRKIKPKILDKLTLEEKKKLFGATNPDIGVNNLGNIVLRDRRTKNTINTSLSLDYILDTYKK